MAEIICFSNFKGGSGKTSSCLGTYSILTNVYNKKVLLVDVDAQCNSTDTMKGDREAGKNVHSLMMKANSANEVIQETENGFVIPATDKLNTAESSIDNVGREFCLSEPLNEIRDDWDYILIDCPPAMDVCTVAALGASDKIVVPVRAEIFSLDGLDGLFRNIIKIKTYYNHNLKVDGILLNQFDTQKSSYKQIQKYFVKLADEYETRVYNTYIRQNITIAEAQLFRQLLHQYDVKSHGFEDFKNFTAELVGGER